MSRKDDFIHTLWPELKSEYLIPEDSKKWIETTGFRLREGLGDDESKCVVPVIMPCTDPVDLMSLLVQESWGKWTGDTGNKDDNLRSILNAYKANKFLDLYGLTKDDVLYRIILVKPDDAKAYWQAQADVNHIMMNDAFFHHYLMDEDRYFNYLQVFVDRAVWMREQENK